MDSLGALEDELSCFKNLEKSLKKTEELFIQVNNISSEDVNENASSLDKARLDIASSQAVHSLFKIYLKITGADSLVECMDRVKELERYTSQANEIRDRKLAPKLDIEASNRFIGHSLKNKEVLKKNKKNKGEGHN